VQNFEVLSTVILSMAVTADTVQYCGYGCQTNSRKIGLYCYFRVVYCEWFNVIHVMCKHQRVFLPVFSCRVFTSDYNYCTVWSM